MAFLDNTGTIRIDAILTDLGRKRMAQGRFKIAKFALGDDEINYDFVDPKKPSTVTDLTNTVTFSSFEALNDPSAVINNCIMDYASDDILYIPQVKVNHKLSESVRPYGQTSDTYYLAANEETATKLTSLLGKRYYFLENNSIDKAKLVFESGIEPPGADSAAGTPAGQLPRTLKSKERYILNYKMYDKYFIINCDNRFISRLLVVKSNTTTFENDKYNNLFYNFQTTSEVAPITLSKMLKYHNAFLAAGINNEVYDLGSRDDNKHSAINGPRATIAAVNFKLVPELTTTSDGAANVRYTRFGKTNQKLFDVTNKFDYIDTVIHIEGTSSAADIQVPVRILRYAGT
tara:strand:- start:4093 stop:5130 length:1038 start_codon:yes stop_codon:yes gene_type:complete